MSGMLFPPPPPGFRYFKPKSSNGVLAKFCSECGSHLDAHAYQWLTGGHGSVRACPPEEQIAPPTTSSSSNTNANNSRQTSGTATPNASHIIAPSSASSARHHHHHHHHDTAATTTTTHQRAYGSHHLHEQMKDVDLSLTSSGTVGDKKTVGNVPAHHRFYGARGAQQQVRERHERDTDVFSKKHDSSIYPRSGAAIPTPEQQQHDDEQQRYYQQQQQYHQNHDECHCDTEEQDQHQHPDPSGYAPHNQSQPGGRSFQLYDESFSTPVPFGTEVDLVNPPPVAGPKGKKHIDRNFETEEVISYPRMSTLRQRMEKGNMSGAGGVCVDQDAVRPDCAIPRSKVKTHRKDAMSTMIGASGNFR